MDVYPFSVQLSWEKDGSPTTSIVFERGGTLPSTKSLTFYRYGKRVIIGDGGISMIHLFLHSEGSLACKEAHGSQML